MYQLIIINVKKCTFENIARWSKVDKNKNKQILNVLLGVWWDNLKYQVVSPRAGSERRNQSTESKEIRQNNSAKTTQPDKYRGCNLNGFCGGNIVYSHKNVLYRAGYMSHYSLTSRDCNRLDIYSLCIVNILLIIHWSWEWQLQY